MNKPLGEHSQAILGEQLKGTLDALQSQNSNYERLQSQLATERKSIAKKVEVIEDILETIGYESMDSVDLGLYKFKGINNLLEQTKELVSAPKSE